MKGRVIKTEEQAFGQIESTRSVQTGGEIAKKCQKINHKGISSHRGKEKCNNISKVLYVDKKKDKYEKHKCKSSFLQIQSCQNQENSQRCAYEGTQRES